MIKNFNAKSFSLFTINYIVGFGFITTISSLIKINIFGIIAFLVSAFIAFCVALVFSKLANNFSEEYGGSYSYAKKLNNKNFSFFIGWNQYIQGPILNSTAPLFLSQIIEDFFSDQTTIWIIRAVSVLVFILLVLISTFGFKTNKWVILFSGIVKWIILTTGFFLSIYLSTIDNNFLSVFKNNKPEVYLIFSSVLSFMYAFGGIEDVATMTKDVSFKNFRKILLFSFAFIFSLYFAFYLVLLGIKPKNSENFIKIFNVSLSITGGILFVIGSVFNVVSSKISINILAARKVAVLAEDGYLFKFLTKKNSNNEFKNAIWFNAITSIFSLIFFYLLPTLLRIGSFFENVIKIGSITFLLQYFFTFVTALFLERKKIISKIHIFEKFLYYIAMFLIAIVLLINIFPFFVNQKWETKNTIILSSYIFFVLIGYIIKLIVDIKNKKIKNKF